MRRSRAVSRQGRQAHGIQPVFGSGKTGVDGGMGVVRGSMDESLLLSLGGVALIRCRTSAPQGCAVLCRATLAGADNGKRFRACLAPAPVPGFCQPHQPLSHSQRISPNWRTLPTCTYPSTVPHLLDTSSPPQRPQHVRELRRPRPTALPPRLHGLFHSHDPRCKQIPTCSSASPPSFPSPTHKLNKALPRRGLPQLRRVSTPPRLARPDRQLHITGL